MVSLFLADIAAAIPMSASTRSMVEAAINAGMGVTAIVAILGGGGLIYFIVRKAFESGVKKIILAA